MTHTPRRDVLKAAGAVAVGGGLAGCAGGEEQSDGQQNESDGTQQDGAQMAGIRVAHMSPDAPNIDVYVDDEPVIEDLGFREVSPYQELDPGRYQVRVTAAGDPETAVFDEEIEIEEGIPYTAVAYGEAAGGPDTALTVDVLEDDLGDPGEEMSRVRLFHASPDVGDVSVVVTQPPGGGQQGNQTEAGQQENQTQDGQPSEQPQQGAVVFESLDFGESATQEIPAGDYSLGVVPADEDGQQAQNETNQSQHQGSQPPVAEFDLTAESHTVYSAFAAGYVSPEEAPVDEAFEVVVVEDAQGDQRADGSTNSSEQLTLSG